MAGSGRLGSPYGIAGPEINQRISCKHQLIQQLTTLFSKFTRR